MKSTYILPLLLLAFAACTHIDYTRRLADADSLLYIRPDSALTLLRGIPPARLDTKEERMRYALLTVEAECRNHIPQRDDSLFPLAVDYFRRTGDKQREARGEYTRGYILYNYLKDGGKAVAAYYRAEELAQSVKNKRLLARVYNGMAYIYQCEGLNRQADSLYKRVEQMAIQMKDTVLWLVSVERQSLYLIGQGKSYYKEAEQRLQQNYERASRYGNPSYQCSNALTLSQLYSYMRDGERTLQFAKIALSLQQKDTTMLSTAFLLTGEGFYRQGIYDSASLYFNKALASPRLHIRSAAYMRLSDIAEKQENAQKALEYEKLRVRNEKLYQQEMQTTEVQLAEHEYVDWQEQLSVWHIVYYCMSAIAGLVLIVIVLFVRARKKERTSQQQLKELLLKEMQAHVEAETTASPVLVSEPQQCIEETEEIHPLFHFDTLQEQMPQTKIYQKLQNILNYYKEFCDYKERFEEKDRREWLEAINQLTGGIIDRLNQKFPELVEEEIYFCSLHLFDFSPTEISVKFAYDRSGIYKKRKSLLKRKFKNEDEIELKDLLKNI